VSGRHPGGYDTNPEGGRAKDCVPLTRRANLAVSIFIAFCCACANGYDGSLMTAILAMPHFQDTFNSGTTGIQVSVIFSLYTVYVNNRSSTSWPGLWPTEPHWMRWC
jgi:hypothetical protein